MLRLCTLQVSPPTHKSISAAGLRPTARRCHSLRSSQPSTNAHSRVVLSHHSAHCKCRLRHSKHIKAYPLLPACNRGAAAAASVSAATVAATSLSLSCSVVSAAKVVSPIPAVFVHAVFVHAVHAVFATGVFVSPPSAATSTGAEITAVLYVSVASTAAGPSSPSLVSVIVHVAVPVIALSIVRATVPAAVSASVAAIAVVATATAAGLLLSLPAAVSLAASSLSLLPPPLLLLLPPPFSPFPLVASPLLLVLVSSSICISDAASVAPTTWALLHSGGNDTRLRAWL